MKPSHNSEGSKSLWMEVELPSFPSLKENANADVCIVGAGIAGLTCAYTLAKQGKSVIVVEQGSLASGQTARTTAHLTWALDDFFHNIEDIFGEEGARLAAESHNAAIDYMEKIIEEERIDCDWKRVDGYLFVPPGKSKEILKKEFDAIQKTGMKINKVDRAPFNSFNTGECLQFPKQAQFHILKYIRGLAEAVQKYGGKIYTQTHIKEFQDDPCQVTTESGAIIQSKAVIVATCTPVNNRFIIHTKQIAYRTYVVGAAIPKGSVPAGLYWDTEDPYHYIRLQDHLSDPNLEWLIIGGEDHRTGQDQEIAKKYTNLEKWAKERFPMINKFDYHWSGQVFEPLDYLGFIGRNPLDKNTYIATGDSGNGMTHGTIAGILIPDLIRGRSNPWRSLYEPSRKTLKVALKFLEETAIIGAQYRDWFTAGELNELQLLPSEEGIILRKGLKKIAVFKDKENHIHAHSAFCPHLGGCVRWNSGEKSWDCPCHGSRFDAYGHVITGPANTGLCPCQENV